MSLIFDLLHTALNIFILALVGRLILDYARIFASSWRPKGIVLGVAEFIYAITDPAVNFVRKFVPPLRLGPVAPRSLFYCHLLWSPTSLNSFELSG